MFKCHSLVSWRFLFRLIFCFVFLHKSLSLEREDSFNIDYLLQDKSNWIILNMKSIFAFFLWTRNRIIHLKDILFLINIDNSIQLQWETKTTSSVSCSNMRERTISQSSAVLFFLIIFVRYNSRWLLRDVGEVFSSNWIVRFNWIYLKISQQSSFCVVSFSSPYLFVSLFFITPPIGYA